MKKFENDFAVAWFEDGIVFLKFQQDTILDLEAIKQTIELGKKITVEENKYMLCDITNIRSVTNEARQYASKYGHSLIDACAVIVNSYFTKFLFTSYTKFIQLDVPFAFFTNKEKAVEWLNELKQQNTSRKSI